MFRLVSVFIICGSDNFPLSPLSHEECCFKVAAYPTADYTSDRPSLNLLCLLSLPLFSQFPALFITWEFPL